MNGADVPPYARIAAELRGRIERGELVAGDRVPSTREITRQWGVAMATATKALAELRRQGLVRAIPGVGTVVETGGRSRQGAGSASRRPGKPDTELHLGRIVTAAVTIADAEGLAALSMRRVAAEIGVSTMSLYRYVADKDDLLLQMMNAVFGKWQLPPESPPGWRSQLELAGRMLWAAFRRHPWLAPAMSLMRPQPIVSALPYTEWVLAVLDEHGLDFNTMLTTHITLLNYVRGTAVNLEAETEAEAATGMDNAEWMQAQHPTLRSLLATGRFPTFNRLLTEEYDFDIDVLFEFGLQRLLDGLAHLIDP